MATFVLAACSFRKVSHKARAGISKRAQFFIVWALSEAALNISGFGLNGYKDAEEKIAKYDRYRNTNMFKVRGSCWQWCLQSSCLLQYRVALLWHGVRSEKAPQPFIAGNQRQRPTGRASTVQACSSLTRC